MSRTRLGPLWVTTAVLLSAVLATGCDTISALGREDPTADAENGDRKKAKRSRADDDGDEERDDDQVLEELEAWIQQAQHDVFVEGDAASYWRIYAEEGQIVTARSESPHPYDYLIPAKRARAFVKLRDELGKVGALDHYTQRYENVTRSMDGDKAVLQWNVLTSWKQPDGVHEAVYGERYTLIRQKKKQPWRVSEKRNWTQSTTRPALENELAAYPKGVKTMLDEPFYAALDAQVDRTRISGGAPLFWALSNAGRHPEAYQLAKMFVAAPNPVGEAFYLLGVAASRLNHGEETKNAYAKARALDPRIYPPRPWGPEPPKPDEKPSKFIDLMRPASAATL